MTRAKIRLFAAAVLFLGWIGYLAFLVAITRDPVILSRPQFFTADVWVIANLKGGEEHPDPEAEVQEVAWPKTGGDANLKGPINIIKLDTMKEANGWTKPGTYILPLMKVGKGTYMIKDTPASPGFNPEKYRFRIYPATPDALLQLRELAGLMKQ